MADPGRLRAVRYLAADVQYRATPQRPNVEISFALFANFVVFLTDFGKNFYDV